MDEYKTPKKISAGIICKNAAATIKQTLESLSWVDDIIVVDNHSTDDTVEIVKKYTSHLTAADNDNFAQKRNLILDQLKTDWILYVDADEVVTPELEHEIKHTIQTVEPGAYSVNRKNFFLQREMYSDRVDRLFHRSIIKSWTGAVHESPVIQGAIKQLSSSLLHYTHQDITSMLEKTNHWSDIEADLRIQAHHPPMAWWRLIRIALTIKWQQFVVRKVGKYGREGLFEGYFQIVDKLIVYTKLWERQRQPH
jgi:glycosyltransferase involved in cell wall biosynthesis